MSGATHTPGPWNVREWTCHARTTVFVPDPSHFSNLRVVAECVDEADARLVAAAPDLLAALREIEAVVLRRGYTQRGAAEMADLAAAAIAKAEGRS